MTSSPVPVPVALRPRAAVLLSWQRRRAFFHEEEESANDAPLTSKTRVMILLVKLIVVCGEAAHLLKRLRF